MGAPDTTKTTKTTEIQMNCRKCKKSMARKVQGRVLIQSRNIRTVGGKRLVQSFCRACRSGK